MTSLLEPAEDEGDAMSSCTNQLREPLLSSQTSSSPEDFASDNDRDDSIVTSTHISQLDRRSLLFYRCLYFLNGLSASAWGRFGVIYYNQDQHLSPQQIGVLLGIMPLLSFFFQPVWGLVADLLQSRKWVYLITKMITTASLLAQALPIVNSFPRLLICTSLMAIFRSSGILDAHCLDFLNQSDNRSIYGTVRMWTAVSWGLGAIIMGKITDAYGFELNFILFGVMMVLMMAVTACGLPSRSQSEEERYNRIHQQQQARPNVQSLFRTLVQLPIVYWLVQVVLIGSGMALVDSFLFLYLQNYLHASTQLCGLTVGVTVLFELPIFAYSQPLLRRLGHDILFTISMAAYVIRVFGYTMLTPSTVHWVLVLELSHGITFACMWIASIDYSASVAPEEWSTTVQSILSTTFGCLSTGVGSIIGGMIFQEWGPIILYRGAGCMVGIVCLIHIVVWRFCGQGHGVFLQNVQVERSADEEDGDNTRSIDIEEQGHTLLLSEGDENIEEQSLVTS